MYVPKQLEIVKGLYVYPSLESIIHLYSKEITITTQITTEVKVLISTC